YSLKEGIEDGFLAPYKVVRVDIDVDLQGWRPTKGQMDKQGNLIEDRIYNQKDFDRTLVIDERTQLVAETITNYLKKTDPMAKTIVFCNDIDHADRMRRALVNLNPDQMAKDDRYVMKITGDDELGKGQLENFIEPKKPYPVIATTSELMTTGVDAKTCKLVVLDQNIQSMTKFKQIIGRGTRIDDKYGKLWFTILDFKKATELFADPRFDGEPERVMVVKPADINNPGEGLGDIIDGADPLPADEPSDNDDPLAPGVDEHPGSYTTGSDGGQSGSGGQGTGLLGGPEPGVSKYYVNGVAVSVIAERVQYYDADGKLVTESFKDYTKKTLLKEFATLDAFTKRWQAAERKQAIMDELAQAGVLWEVLQEEVGKELDPFDLICHVVYDQPPLTRRERANNVKKRNYFTKYNDTAQLVLTNLLDKYADQGVTEIETKDALKVAPFTELGRPLELAKKGFGGPKQFEQAITELEQEIYRHQEREQQSA
ncbi:MAG: EcoAI/FtnUII family type I restriction enzme subunit R, partial [Aeromonas sobria]|uniref:EcoAI/FtnUII family type I restriction enzme subunit R n=1 Tax=Aeromonas sobria TaxID=646 RepID=UPI003F39AF3C